MGAITFISPINSTSCTINLSRAARAIVNASVMCFQTSSWPHQNRPPAIGARRLEALIALLDIGPTSRAEQPVSARLDMTAVNPGEDLLNERLRFQHARLGRYCLIDTSSSLHTLRRERMGMCAKET